MLCCNTLNITDIVSVCEQQSTEKYIHFGTVWVMSGEEATNILFRIIIFSRSSSRNNCGNAERIFMKLDISGL